MRAKSILALVALTVSAPSIAAPVNLKCEVANMKISFSLDEDRGTATYTTSVAQTHRAIFTPEKVIVVTSNDRFARAEWRIDRTTLAIERFLQIGTSPATIDAGKCVLFTPEKRAF